MKRWAILLLFAGGCSGPEGLALDLTVALGCLDPALIDRVEVEVVLTPPSPRDAATRFTIPGAGLLGNPGKSDHVVLLLDRGTQTIDVLLRAVDPDGVEVGVGVQHFALPRSGEHPGTVVLGNQDCPVELPDGGAGFDLTVVDLDAPDLGDAGPPDLVPALIEAQGHFGVTLYEGEGRGFSSADRGVAVLLNGAFTAGSTVTTDYGTLGQKLVSSDGKRLATSLSLPVDENLAEGVRRPFTLTVDGVNFPLEVVGLPELDVLPTVKRTLALTSEAPVLYSRVTIGALGELTFTCANHVAFLWVTGTIQGGTIKTTVSCGGRYGCNTKTCGGGSGPGFGIAGGALSGGGGAGFAGFGGAGGGGAGGSPYRDATVVSLPGGSGGGSANLGNIAGGAGGGVLRVHAGRIQNVGFHADGSYGAGATSVFGGSGSGGTLLIEAESSAVLTTLSAGGAGALGTGLGKGGAGSAGRIRVDVGDRTWTNPASANPQAGYNGAMLAEETPSAFGAPPAQLTVICNGQPFVVEVDGVVQGGLLTCSSPLAATSVPVAIVPGLHRVCVRNQHTQTLRYTTLPEDRNCRPIAVAGP